MLELVQVLLPITQLYRKCWTCKNPSSTVLLGFQTPFPSNLCVCIKKMLLLLLCFLTSCCITWLRHQSSTLYPSPKVRHADLNCRNQALFAPYVKKIDCHITTNLTDEQPKKVISVMRDNPVFSPFLFIFEFIFISQMLLYFNELKYWK